MVVLNNDNDRGMIRLYEGSNIQRDTLQHEWEYFSSVEFKDVIQCKIISSNKKSYFKKIQNMKNTSASADISGKWMDQELKMLRTLGLEI